MVHGVGFMKTTKEKQGIQVCRGGKTSARKTLQRKGVIAKFATDLLDVKKLIGVGLNQSRGFRSPTNIVRDLKPNREMAATMMEEDLQVKLFSGFNKDEGSSNALGCDARNGFHLDEALFFNHSESSENCKNSVSRDLSCSNELRSYDHRKRKNSIYQNGESNELTVDEESLQKNSRLSAFEATAVDKVTEISQNKETSVHRHRRIHNRKETTKPRVKRERKKKVKDINTTSVIVLSDRTPSKLKTNGSLYCLNNDIDCVVVNKSVGTKSPISSESEKSKLLELEVTLTCENSTETVVNTEVVEKKPVSKTSKRKGRLPKTSVSEKTLIKLNSPVNDFNSVKIKKGKRKGGLPVDNLCVCADLEEEVSINEDDKFKTIFIKETANDEKEVKRGGRLPTNYIQVKVTSPNDLEDIVEPVVTSCKGDQPQTKKKPAKTKSDILHADIKKVVQKKRKTSKSDICPNSVNSFCVENKEKPPTVSIASDSNSDVPIKRGRGRPPGARNKPKTEKEKLLKLDIKRKRKVIDNKVEKKKKGKPPAVIDDSVNIDGSCFKKKLVSECENKETTINCSDHNLSLKKKRGRPRKSSLSSDHTKTDFLISSSNSLDIFEFSDDEEYVTEKTVKKSQDKQEKKEKKKSKQKKKMEPKLEKEIEIQIVLGARRIHESCELLVQFEDGTSNWIDEKDFKNIDIKETVIKYFVDPEQDLPTIHRVPFDTYSIKMSPIPNTTKPDITESNITEPNIMVSNITQPNVTEPNITEPNKIEPNIMEPIITEPNITEPNISEPNIMEPNITEPCLNSSTCSFNNLELSESQVMDTEIDNNAPCVIPQPKQLYRSYNNEIEVIKTDYVHITVRHYDNRTKRIKRETCVEFIEHLEDASVDESNVVVLSGIEEYFSCAKDMEKLLTFPAECETRNYDEDIVTLRYLFQTLKNFPKPIIAVVNKPATGMASSILSLVDMIYDESSKYCAQKKYTRSRQSPLILPRLMGLSSRNESLLMGELPKLYLENQIKQCSDIFQSAKFTKDLKETLKDMKHNDKLSYSRRSNRKQGRPPSKKNMEVVSDSNSEPLPQRTNLELEKLEQKIEQERLLAMDCLKDIDTFWNEILNDEVLCNKRFIL